MNREEVIRMAEEAGISIGAFGGRYQRQLERFAALAAEWGAKQEREACAKVCERYWSAASLESDRTATAIAAAIRKRGEVQP